jgi:type II secretory pathway pseudopilin PulG
MKVGGPLSSGIRLSRRFARVPAVPGGFSIIELVVVLGLMLVMTYLMMSRMSHSAQEKHLINCRKNLQMIGVALNLYANDNHDALPYIRGAATSEGPLSLLVPRCTTVTEIFICPGSKDKQPPEGQPFPNGRISYAYFMRRGTNVPGDLLLSDRQVDTTPKRQGAQVFSIDGKSPGDNHTKYGGNLMFGDGHVDFSPPQAARDWLWPTNVAFLNPRP